MSGNKNTVRKYMDAYGRSAYADVLACLTDDVEWIVPGAFHLHGKDAFHKEMHNDGFTGTPRITLTRLVEEDDVVVAEGTVQTTRRDGTALSLVFCDVFVMQDARVKHLTSYLMEAKGT